VLRFLKIRGARKTLLKPATVKQSDVISAEWEARYREVKEPLALA
jgi:hypothetical protein